MCNNQTSKICSAWDFTLQATLVITQLYTDVVAAQLYVSPRQICTHSGGRHMGDVDIADEIRPSALAGRKDNTFATIIHAHDLDLCVTHPTLHKRNTIFRLLDRTRG